MRACVADGRSFALTQVCSFARSFARTLGCWVDHRFARLGCWVDDRCARSLGLDVLAAVREVVDPDAPEHVGKRLAMGAVRRAQRPRGWVSAGARVCGYADGKVVGHTAAVSSLLECGACR